MNSIATLNLESLPSDVEASHEVIRALASALAETNAQLESLKAQIVALRRAQFGAKSEKLAGQGEIFAEPASLPVPAVQTETITYERQKRGRPALPKDLPRVRIEYELTEAEKAAFEELERIGEELSETLDYIPASCR